MPRNASPGAIGLDIGPRHIAALQFERRDGRMGLRAAAMIKRTATAGATPGPELTREEGARLEAVLFRQGFHGRHVVAAVPDQFLLSSILELPPRSSGAPLEQLAGVELARAHKQEAEAIESGSWEIPPPARSSETTHMMAAGCTHEVANAVLDPLEDAGLNVSVLDARSWALARAAAARCPDEMHGISALLDIGDAGALLTMLHGQTPVYRRFMSDGGLESLCGRLMQKLALDSETAWYATRTLLDSASTGSGDSGMDKEVEGFFEEHVGMLLTELTAAAEYVGHRYPPGLQRVLLSGPIASAAGLMERLSGNFAVPIERGVVSGIAEVPGALVKVADDPSLFAAAGLALASLGSAA